MNAAVKPERQVIADPVRIAEAKTPEELEAIYRFRYRIYIEEMDRVQHDADHERCWICDALDDNAINLAAWRNGEVIGVLRANLSAAGSLGYYESFYDMAQVGNEHPNRTCVVTRVMVAKHLRNTRVSIDLLVAAFEVGMHHQIRWCFMDCNDHLVRFFAALGFVEYAPPKTHKEYGAVRLMLLDLEDHGHLRRMRSPHCRALAAPGISAPASGVQSIAY